MFPQLAAKQQVRVVEEIGKFISMTGRKGVETEAISLTAETRRA
jgi:hypothetical protein